MPSPTPPRPSQIAQLRRCVLDRAERAHQRTSALSDTLINLSLSLDDLDEERVPPGEIADILARRLAQANNRVREISQEIASHDHVLRNLATEIKLCQTPGR